ncbi:MAG: enoyl-CoA hydratase/isomerase family protein [Gemmatimonadaceae bacterium]|nr:enoyl-CoA hydratase/isomerase family protein [Gemmatimonadaceae bacterium]
MTAVATRSAETVAVADHAAYTRIRVARSSGLGVITLARPERRNALDRATADELHAAIRALAADHEVRVIVLEGEGADFCAGADLAALEAMLDAGPEVHIDDARALGRVFAQLRGLNKPTVAIVRGRALAGGAGLATACDIVLAEEGATFGYPEVRIGFVPAMVMSMLRRAVGEKRAAELVLTARVVDAAEAERIGLASRCIPTASFAEEVGATLERLVASPPVSLELTKRLLYRIDDMDFAAGIAAGITTNVEARATEAFREGVRRFVRKDRA